MKIETKAKREIEKMLAGQGYEAFRWICKECKAMHNATLNPAYVSYETNDKGDKARICGVVEVFNPELVHWNGFVIVDRSKG